MAGKRGRRGWGWIRRSGSRWHASYVGPDVRRHNAPNTYGTKIDAEGWLASERKLIDLGMWTPPAQREAEKLAAGITVADYAQEWIDHRKLKPRTRINYQSLLDNQIADSVGVVPLKHLSPQTVRGWFSGLDSGPTGNSHAYGLLHAVCATAVADGLLAANPCNIPKAMNTPTKKKAVILDVSEVGALADAMKPERLRMMILLAAWCGPRWGEVSELRRKDIGKDCKSISIARGVVHRSGECHIDSTKNTDNRTVSVPPHIVADLKEHLKNHVDDSPEALLFPPATDRGCGHIKDKVFRDSYYLPALDRIGRDGVKLPRPTFHDLRHFSGTQTARVGNLRETMDRLGHRTPRASMIYQQSVNGRDAQIAAELSKLAQIDTPKAG